MTRRAMRYIAGRAATLIALTLVLVGHAHRARGDAPTRNGTPTFKRLYREAQAGRDTLPPDARDFRYLFVGGLFSNRVPGTFNEATARLTSLGLDVQRVRISSERGTRHNAGLVRREVRRAARDGKKVVLIGQSKGGVDIATALQLDPRLAQNVVGVIAFQAPVNGSRIAEVLTTNRSVRGALGRLLNRLFGGNVRALDEITPAYRARLAGKHPYPSNVPTLSILGKSPATSPMRIIAGIFRLAPRHDGMVAPHEARIAGSTVVRLAMDHGGPVLGRLPIIRRRLPGSRYDAGSLTQAAVSQVLSMRGPRPDRARRPSRPTMKPRRIPGPRR